MGITKRKFLKRHPLYLGQFTAMGKSDSRRIIEAVPEDSPDFPDLNRASPVLLEATVVYQQYWTISLEIVLLYLNNSTGGYCTSKIWDLLKIIEIDFPPAVTTTSSFRFADDVAHFPEGKFTTWGVRAGSKRVKWHRFNRLERASSAQLKLYQKWENRLTSSHIHTQTHM